MPPAPRAWLVVLAVGAPATVPAFTALRAPVPSPRQAQALVRAALVDLSRAAAFRTVRSAPSLTVVAVVEPRKHAEAATLHFRGPRGVGVVRSVVASGVEDLFGDASGWRDFLLQDGAPATDVAQAAALAGHWYSTTSSVRFGPGVGGIGHVLCVGSGCNLAGARALGAAVAGRITIELPHLGGRLVVRTGAHPLPLEFDGTGASRGVKLRFGYLRLVPPVTLPKTSAPLPPALGG